MSHRPSTQLDPKKAYLQIALNSTLEEAQKIIFLLPKSDRIIIEAGTPLIKRYGQEGISAIREWANTRFGTAPRPPYIVADMKTMDRGETEVLIAKNGGANAVIALGHAPIETLNAFLDNCEKYQMDAMVDMMNVEFPLSVLRSLKKVPPVVLLHRGVDEERFNKEKQIPLHEIRRIKGNYNIMISIAGGDTIREVQRSLFNDSDIAVIWKSVFQSSKETVRLVEEFLKVIK